MKHLLVAIIAVALLAGCTAKPRIIEISATPNRKIKLVLSP